MKRFKVICNWWSFGKLEYIKLVKDYDAESKEQAEKMFWDDYPPMLGTGNIERIEEIR